MPIVWLPGALEDFERIIDYAAAAGKGEELLAAVRRLGGAPYLGRPKRAPDTRELALPSSNAIIYRARSEAIEILAVFAAPRLDALDFHTG